MGTVLDHPTRCRPLAPPAPAFVVALTFDGLARGVAGPFASEAEADAWVGELLGGEEGWAALVVPMTAPDALPSAAERRAARRRHLSVVRDAPPAVGHHAAATVTPAATGG